MLSKISKLKVGLLSGIVMTATNLNTRNKKTYCDKNIEETWWKKKAFQELTEPIKQYVSER